MKSPDTRFYVPDLKPGDIRLSKEESAHALRACRARKGDILKLTDGNGHFAEGTVETEDPAGCLVRIESMQDSAHPRPLLHLGIACLKDDGNEEVSLHVGEMEVASITLFRTDHSEEPRESGLEKTVRRCELKALVSLKQSMKDYLTEIRGPFVFRDWLKSYAGDLILCDLGGERLLEPPARETTLLVGPEGGFSEEEITLIQNYASGSVRSLNLGQTRLRARTAAIVGIGKLVP